MIPGISKGRGGAAAGETCEHRRVRRNLIAVNTAPDSENRMHGDEAARYGFSSGLVPGVDVLGYLAHAGVERWGAAWLEGGRLDGRLIAPVYDREEVVVAASDAGSGLDATVAGPDGDDVRARARLALLDDAAVDVVGERIVSTAPDIGILPEPDERPPAARELLEAGTVLGTQWATFHAEKAGPYLDEISEDHPVFRVDGLAHPGWLLRFSNWALSCTVRLGPWIHVGSDAWFLRSVADGDTIEVRAVVTDRFERKGHDFVDLAVVYRVDERIVAFVDHRAIWKPRRSG
jgi:hypothetical protein